MINKVLLLGHLGQDPEIHITRGGKKMANLSLATTKKWKDKETGERKESTQWHRVVIFNEALAGIVEKYARKGSKLWLEGELATRKWKTKTGEDRYSTEVVVQGFGGALTLLDKREKKPDPNPEDYGYDEGYASGPDDEVPF